MTVEGRGWRQQRGEHRWQSAEFKLESEYWRFENGEWFVESEHLIIENGKWEVDNKEEDQGLSARAGYWGLCKWSVVNGESAVINGNAEWEVGSFCA